MDKVEEELQHLQLPWEQPQLGLADNQEQKKEEVVAKVSNQSLLLVPLTLPLPSLKICHPKCGPTESKLLPHLGPDNNSSYPDDLEPGGWPNQGPAGDQGQQMSLLLRA